MWSAIQFSQDTATAHEDYELSPLGDPFSRCSMSRMLIFANRMEVE